MTAPHESLGDFDPKQYLVKAQEAYPDSYWWHIDAAFRKVDIYNGGEALQKSFTPLPAHIKDLVVAHWFLSEIANGGVAQFYLNPTGVLAPEAASSFASMGLPVVADAVRRSLTIFGASFPRDEESRVTALLRIAKKNDPEEIFESNLFSDIETAIYDFGGTDLGRIYDRMDAYAKERANQPPEPMSGLTPGHGSA